MSSSPGNRLRVCLIFACTIVLAAALSSQATEQEPLDHLRTLRLSLVEGEISLTGSLRHEGDRTLVEVHAAGGKVTFRLPEENERFIVVADGEAAHLLHTVGDAAPRPLEPQEAAKPIAGSAVSPADLVMDFLYWPIAERRPDDKLLGLPARQIRVKSGSKGSTYAAADLYMDKQSGALLQALCYDWNGRLVKRFKVTRGQRVNGRWMLAQMRVEMLSPNSGRVIRRSYLDFKLPQQEPDTSP